MDGILDTIATKAPVVLAWTVAIVGSASVAAAAIAPLTKTKWDDRLAGLLSKLKGLLDKVALNPKV